MFIQKLLLPSLLSIALLASSQLMARSNIEDGKSCKHKKQCSFLNKLTSEQRQQVKTIMRSHKREFKPLFKKMRSVHQQLKEKYNQEKPLWQEIKPLVEQMNRLKAEKYLLKAKIKFEIFEKTGIKLPPRKHHRRMMKHKNAH